MGLIFHHYLKAHITAMSAELYNLITTACVLCVAVTFNSTAPCLIVLATLINILFLTM